MRVLWFYDSDLGQGWVMAADADEARRKAIRDVGRHNSVSNVHRPTDAEVAWFKAMGGKLP